jgi:3',5'-cyclic AMP phosphodiesterase CpdA
MYVLTHLSDPHIGPLPQPRFGDLTSKQMVGYLNWRRRRSRVHRLDMLEALTRDLAAQAHDHTAVTGDLVNIALPGEFALAQAWLDQLGAPADVTFVPGNHDAYVRTALPYWDRHWTAFMQGDGEPLGNDDGVRFPFLRRRGPVGLIGLSTAVPTPPLSAAGRLGEEQIARMAELLRSLAGEGLFRVVLIHHPPRRKWASPHKRLIDTAQFRDAIAQTGSTARNARSRRSECRPPRPRPTAMTSRPATIFIASRAAPGAGPARRFRADSAAAGRQSANAVAKCCHRPGRFSAAM